MMTLEEAKEELPNIDYFCISVCDICTANDWYCPSYCGVLEKARRMSFERIQKAYARHDGDLCGVIKYIKGARG